MSVVTLERDRHLLVIGVNELVPGGRHLKRAVELASGVASNAPLAVQAALASARAGKRAARNAARAVLFERNPAFAVSADAAEGLAAFLERRTPTFLGR